MNTLLRNITNYFSEFKVLTTVSKDFWFVNITNFFQGMAYFSMITVITLYLTANAGFSDIDAGVWVSFYTVYIVAVVFMVGPICDIIGIKKTMYIGLGFLILAYGGMTFSPGLFVQDTASLIIKGSLIALAIGTAFIGAPLNTALRRFTKKKNRATGFNVYYLLMNIGAILANSLMVEGFRRWFGPTAANVWILGGGFVACILALFFASLINEDNYEEDSERLEKEESRRPMAIFTEVWKERSFQKLIFFLVVTIGVRLVFTNQFLVMPKYYTRVLSEDFELGYANAINPIIIVLGLIAVIPIINKYSTVKLMILGMAISATSLFIICIPPQYIMGLPFIDSITSAYLFAIVLQIVIFAFGELIFMPRFQEYIASIAPKDKVASYMALASLPMFIAKPINGFLSGVLITYFCYDGIRAKIDTGVIDYGDSPEYMWLIYAILAIMSPVAVIVFKRFFLDHSPGDAAPRQEGNMEAGHADTIMEPVPDAITTETELQHG